MPEKFETSGNGDSIIRAERLKKLCIVTEDYEILDSVNDTAFSQDELESL